MRLDSRHVEVRGLRLRIFASPQTNGARWLPIHLHALSSTHRWRDRARQRRSIETIPFSSSWRFDSYLLVPGCDAFLILHGIAEPFGLDTELAKSVQSHQPAMRVECHDMGEDAAEGEGLSRLAQGVDESIVPGGMVADVAENPV